MQLTGTATTGHEWDGIHELNTPLPRWWLWTFYACIVWAIGYWVVYPAWPLVSSYTDGVFGWHARSAVVDELDALQQQRAPMMDEARRPLRCRRSKRSRNCSISRARWAAVPSPTIARPATARAAAARTGYPNLNDDDWLWGGTARPDRADDHRWRRVRDDKGHQGAMPPFGRRRPEARRDRAVADYVRSLSGLCDERGADLAAGKKIFADNCAPCHGPEGKGNREVGSANLTDNIWLYGSDLQTLEQRSPTAAAA